MPDKPDKKLLEFKKEYLETPIPKELDFVVKKALKEAEIKMNKQGKGWSAFKITAASLVASLAILITGLNTSPVLAQNLQKMPLVGSIVQVLTFREYEFNQGTFNAHLETPGISGLANKDLESSLNAKYLQENEKLYQEFVAEMAELEAKGGGHLGIDSGYVVKTDDQEILSIGRYVVNTVASSSTVMKYDTIDKEKEVLITLPSLFKDGADYVKIISAYIQDEMLRQHQADGNKIYWVAGIETDFIDDLFTDISAEQNFYINPDHKLVISFDKYQVAPGYMGIVEFVIPTEIIDGILVSDEYIF